MSIYEALSAVMVDVQAVAKNDRNDHQRFNFRGIDAVVNAVGPALRKHKVIVVPDVREHRFGTVEVGQKRTPMGHCVVHVAYVFYGPDGDSVECSVVAEAMDSGDKAYPKAMSVAFRTALLQALTLPTDEPDPDASSYERAAQQAAPVEDPVKAAARDKELNDLLKQAEDLVDAAAVMEYASRGSAELAASKHKLREKIAEAEAKQ
jgi:hypothetical protein